MLLEHVLADQRRVPRCAAAQEDDALDAEHLLGRHVEAAQARQPLFHHHSSAHRVANRFGLVEDLLQHEVLEAALLDFPQVPLDFLHRLVHRHLADGRRVEPLGREHGHLAVVEVHDLAGVAHDRGDVRGQEVFAVCDAHHERAALARAHHRAWLLRAHHSDPVRAFHAVQPEQRREHRHLPRFKCFSTRCASTSVSVSVRNEWPSATSALFSTA